MHFPRFAHLLNQADHARFAREDPGRWWVHPESPDEAHARSPEPAWRVASSPASTCPAADSEPRPGQHRTEPRAPAPRRRRRGRPESSPIMRVNETADMFGDERIVLRHVADQRADLAAGRGGCRAQDARGAGAGAARSPPGFESAWICPRRWGPAGRWCGQTSETRRSSRMSRLPKRTPKPSSSRTCHLFTAREPKSSGTFQVKDLLPCVPSHHSTYRGLEQEYHNYE